ncbi:MAG: hypothetical protein BGO01_13140 [Armatimonadetes bacterium 55-13]|nr:MAG: hypothetical protein BGO01_13140 [Armatimonadetes bacterium 55-13]
MRSIWRVEMLGTLQAVGEDAAVSRFRTRRVGLLLAYLAYFSERSHSREELAEMLWPECEPELGRRNLRQTLSSLRRPLEPPGVPAGAVLTAKQGRVSLNLEFVNTDVAEFKAAVRSERTDDLRRAVEVYRGDLLPGHYEDWVLRERLHLEDLYVSALKQLVKVCEAEGRVDEGIHYVRLALAKDNLQEDLHAALMRFYIASERSASALQHFEDWRATAERELNDEPGLETRRLAERARRSVPATVGETIAVVPLEPARSERSQIIRLPVQLTRFFGREEDRERALGSLLEGVRLVSFLGPAGTGKTRLSVEVGRRLAEQQGWNVWFVSLADYADGAQLLSAVCEGMRLPTEAGNSPLEAISANLSGAKNLLILDNLEHILESAIPRVQSLLTDVPNVAILVTSRHSLKLEGEHEMDLGTLPIPKDESDLAGLAEAASVQLFVDRAQAVVPDFQLTAHNSRAVAAICTQLDGLPLALEIAAGLSHAFTPLQMLQNLEHRLELLRSRRRDLSERHRSLRAAIDYSYELLSPELQRFFMALSVFRGGVTLEAADRVCGVGATLRMTLDLQERSLLRADEAAEGSPARFRLLESFREYGAELLSGEELGDLKARHAAYYREQGKAAAQHDRENLLAALRFYFDEGQPSECVALLVALHGFTMVGHDVTRALAVDPRFDSFEPLDQIMLLRLLADAHLYPSEFEESYRVSERALEIARRIGREDQVAICKRGVGVAAGYLGRREEGIALTREFLAYAEKVGDLRMMEHAYNAIGTELWVMGRGEEARKEFDGALLAARKLHGSEIPWQVHYNQGRVRLDAGELDDGMQFANDGVRASKLKNEELGLSMCLSLVARYHRLKGNQTAALATSHESMVRRRKVGFSFWTLLALMEHAMILAEIGRSAEAATLLAASRGVTRLNRVMDDREFSATVDRVKSQLSETAFEQAWAEGLGMNMDEAFWFAARFR